MKIFDWVIILAYNKHVHIHDLQFSYQANVLTPMCTWMAIETMSYFMRNGSDVFSCMVDVKHSTLFRKLLVQGMPCIIVRYLLISYWLLQANVGWRNEISDFFTISNGVKQGLVLLMVRYYVCTPMACLKTSNARI